MRVRTSVAVAAASLLLLAGCSDSTPEASSTPEPSPAEQSTTIPTPSTPTLTPLPKPTKPWPTPKVTGAPDDDAPLASRIRFAIAEQAQIAAGKAATTKVDCPGIDEADEPGEHNLTCTVTYAGKSYSGRLTVDSERYNASYKFTSDSVAIVEQKVVDAVLRAASDAAKVTCTMDSVAVVKHTSQGIACDVTTVDNEVQPYRARVSGNGQVLVSKA